MANCDFNQSNTKFAPGLCTFAKGQPCHVCKEASLFEESLSKTHTNIADVEAQRRALRSKMNAHHDPITSKLPPEIVSYMFVWFMEEPLADARNLYLGNELDANSTQYQWVPPYCRRPGEIVKSSLQLGTICRSWRQLVWSTPRLWTKIGVDFEDTKICANHVELFTACLSRSATLPLHVILRNDSYRHVENESLLGLGGQPVKALLDTFLRHMNRVINLDLMKLPQAVYEYLGCDSDRVIRPKLESLKLSMDLKSNAEKIAINATWEHLTRVILSGIRLQDTNIQWNNVTHLRVHNFNDLAGSLEVLSQSPRLQYLSISTGASVTTLQVPFSGSIIKHKALKYLELNTLCVEDAAYFLQQTAFPVLEEFKVELWRPKHVDDRPINDAIGPYFTQSSIRLRRMSLVDVRQGACEELIELLEAMPSLEYIDLQAVVGYGPEESLDIVLEHLAASSGTNARQGNFLPKLKELYIHGAPTFNWMLIPAIFSPAISFPGSALLADSAQTLEVPATTRHPRPLTSLRVDYEHRYDESPGPIGRESAAQLLRLIEQGNVITVGPGPSPGRILQAWIDFHQLSQSNLPSDRQ